MTLKKEVIGAGVIVAVVLIANWLFVPQISHGHFHPPQGMRCNVNFGDAPTVTTADNGCVYDGPTRPGGIPEGWYANTSEGRVDGPAVIWASVLTMRPMDGSAVPVLAEAPAPPPPVEDIPPAGMRCNVNFGDAPTVTTADNGCLYNGELRPGGIPEGWYANTPSGDVYGFAVIEAQVLTLRRIDKRPVPVLPGPVPAAPPVVRPSTPPATAPAPAPPAPAPAPVVSACSTTQREVATIFVPYWMVDQLWQFFIRGSDPRMWVFNPNSVAGVPHLDFSIPQGWKVDWVGGTGSMPGTRVRANTFTAWCTG